MHPLSAEYILTGISSNYSPMEEREVGTESESRKDTYHENTNTYKAEQQIKINQLDFRDDNQAQRKALSKIKESIHQENRTILSMLTKCQRLKYTKQKLQEKLKQAAGDSNSPFSVNGSRPFRRPSRIQELQTYTRGVKLKHNEHLTQQQCLQEAP